MSATPFPDPPDASPALADVGNECAICERNIGMYPVATVCRFCRPVTQESGDTITGIAVTRSGEWTRLPTTALSIDDEGRVSLESRDVAFTTDPPIVTAGGANSFVLADGDWTMFRVRFHENERGGGP